MKTTTETITPKRAQTILDNHLTPFVAEDINKQRRVSEQLIDSYARAMRAGQWGTTHQGIAIDSNGLLVDGQHRLMAIVRSGATIKTMITRGLPANGEGTTHGVKVIDMIDRGKVRGVGQQLQMRHGILDANYYAAMCRTILMLGANALKVTTLPVDVGQCLRVIDMYGTELRDAHQRKAKLTGLRSATIGGAIAFAMKAGDKQRLREFSDRIRDGENLSKGNPALTIRNYLLSHYKEFSGGVQVYRIVTRATLTAAMHADKGQTLRQIKTSEIGYSYFMEKQRRSIVKLLSQCGYQI